MNLRFMNAFKRIVIIAGALAVIAGLTGISESYGEYRWKKVMYSPGLKGKTVILDPGHGGTDPGAVAEGVRETELNMKLALELKTKLEQRGVRVELTRSEDDGLIAKKTMSYLEQWMILQKRKRFALDRRGHIFLSLHANSHKSPAVSGGIVFYSDEISAPLAQDIQERLNNLDTRKRQVERKNFTVINNNEMPSVLIEAGFITHPGDRERLVSQSGQVAELIAEGLENYARDLKPPVSAVAEEPND